MNHAFGNKFVSLLDQIVGFKNQLKNLLTELTFDVHVYINAYENQVRILFITQSNVYFRATNRSGKRSCGKLSNLEMF